MADLGLYRQSPLSDFGSPASYQTTGIAIVEKPAASIGLLIGHLHQIPADQQLPSRPGDCVRRANTTFICLAPDRILILCDAATEVSVGADPMLSVHDVTDAWLRIRLDGPASTEVLAAATAANLDESCFTQGMALLTEFGGTRCIILRNGSQSFDLLLDVSVARYAWHWLLSTSNLVGVAASDRV